MPPFTSSATDLAARTAGTWMLDPQSSVAGFTVGNFVVRSVSGRIPLTAASLTVSDEGSVSVWVEADVAAIDTGHARRDVDLRKPALLDLERHSSLVFQATRLVETAAGWLVPGQLTAKDTTRELELTATVVPEGEHLRVHATGQLDRRDYGITAPRFLIGALVDVEVDAVFTR